MISSSVQTKHRRHAGVLVVMVVLAGMSGRSVAQTSAQKQEAQKKAVAGAKLLDQGKPRAALQLLQEAYEQFQDARYQYNIGLAYQALGQDTEALLAFQRFIEGSQTKALPEHLADAVQQEHSLRRKVGEIQLACTQEAAQVLVDGQERGKTPDLSSLFMSPGAHTL